ncbi:hypothetical protein G6N82_12195 [Altererythrobacter sp. BO-6]|uniref:hypothetical protein n=1 Tax=Altererythrobacter sp. BO-6 TaxID=2604537 RepID=UPI0013E1A109|nr:hypothetical protein [Altererythrobacter sp. BO-6]QIG54811.1 hypothetical protein G6N82_12195 [Altererythrobacter sp. BO-6]
MIDDQEALARKRFMVMNLMRVSGLVLVLLGIAIARGVIDLPAPVGWVLAAIGLFDFFFVPSLLARSWRKNDR